MVIVLVKIDVFCEEGYGMCLRFSEKLIFPFVAMLCLLLFITFQT